MPTAWPPANVVWPPPPNTHLEFADIDSLERWITANFKEGYRSTAPSNAENNSIFSPARCNLGHTVTGRVLVAPNGVRYPYFARCNTDHDAEGSRALFFPWEPFYWNDFRR